MIPSPYFQLDQKHFVQQEIWKARIQREEIVKKLPVKREKDYGFIAYMVTAFSLFGLGIAIMIFA